MHFQRFPIVDKLSVRVVRKCKSQCAHWLTWRLSLHYGADVIDNGVKLILLEQACHLSSHENLVDVLQEAFLLDLSVCEDEGNRLPFQPSHLVQTFDVFKQVRGVVCLGDCDLEGHGTCTDIPVHHQL